MNRMFVPHGHFRQDDPASSEKSSRTPSAFWFVFFACGAVLVQVGVGFALLHYLDNWDDRGTFGDMFGAVNALFSGLALAGIVFTLLLQRAGIELQQKELRLMRAESTATRETQTLQAIVQAQQFLAWYTQNTAAASHQLRQIEKDVVNVDQWARRGSPPDTNPQLERFLKASITSIQEHLGTFAYTLGSGPELQRLLAVYELWMSVIDRGSWIQYHDFIQRYGAIQVVLAECRSAFAAAVEKRVASITLSLASIATATPTGTALADDRAPMSPTWLM